MRLCSPVLCTGRSAARFSRLDDLSVTLNTQISTGESRLRLYIPLTLMYESLSKPNRGKRAKSSESAKVQVMPFTFETPGTMNINGGVFTDVAGDINKIRIQNYHSAEAGMSDICCSISFVF